MTAAHAAEIEVLSVKLMAGTLTADDSRRLAALLEAYGPML
jgi:hypothetical protein